MFHHKLFAAAVMLASTVVVQASDDSIVWSPLHEPGGGGAIVSLEVSPHDPLHIVSGGDMLGVATSFDGGETWQPTFGFSAYEMATPTYHPTERDVVWIGSCMGPWKSTDRGIHWKSYREGMPTSIEGRYTAIVEKIVFDPDQPARLLAFGGTSRRWSEADSFGWVWESTDDGANWKHIATLFRDGTSSTRAAKGGNIVWADYEPKSDSTVHAILDGGAWMRSIDDGKTWTRVVADGIDDMPISGLTFDPRDPAVVYITTHNRKTDAEWKPGGIYKSTDGGKTARPIDSSITKITSHASEGEPNLTSWFKRVALSPADPDTLFVNDQAWNVATIYRSDDAGSTWKPVAWRKPIGRDQDVQHDDVAQVTTATFAGVCMTLTADPVRAGVVYGFNTEFVLRTRDNGKTWDDATAYRPDPSKPDAWRGRGWNGWCSREIRFNPYNPSQLVLQMMDAGRAWISDDDGHSWRYSDIEGVTPWLAGMAVTFTRDGHIFGTTGQFGGVNGITRSRDGGKTWESLFGKPRGLPNSGWSEQGTMGGIYAHPDDSRRAWAVVNHEILGTVDGGETWTRISNIAKFDWIEPDPTKADRFYVSADDGIYVTEDGMTFTNIGGPRPVNRSKMHVDVRGRLYAAQWRVGRAGVWRYTPSLKRWERLLDEGQAVDLASDPKDPTRLVVVTTMDPYFDTAGGNGVWFSHDDGKSWSRHVAGLAMLRSNCVEFDPKNGERVIIGTYGRGFFQTTWQRSFQPQGTRRYTSTPEDEAATQPVARGTEHTIRSFQHASFDYFYGLSWEGNAKHGDGTVWVRGTENGGGGIVINGSITPNGQNAVQLNIRPLKENEAESLSLNIIREGQPNTTLRVDLSQLQIGEWNSVILRLPEGDYTNVSQLQLQGNNFSDDARPVAFAIESIRTLKVK